MRSRKAAFLKTASSVARYRDTAPGESDINAIVRVFSSKVRPSSRCSTSAIALALSSDDASGMAKLSLSRLIAPSMLFMKMFCTIGKICPVWEAADDAKQDGDDDVVTDKFDFKAFSDSDPSSDIEAVDASADATPLSIMASTLS
jgi:hypothetical protein